MLQIWLPLNQNLNNQGVANVTVTGGAIDNSGKLGKCYKVNSSSPITITHSLDTTANFTFAFWMKIPANMATGTGWEQIMIFSAINVAGGSASSTGINWANYDSVKIYDDSKHQWLWAYPNSQFQYDTWHHWVVAHEPNGDGVRCRIYIDGALVGTYNNTTEPLKLISGTIRFGGGIITDYLYFNDIRVYNHTLSDKEIKLLSQGLVVHYPLSDLYAESTTNLFTATPCSGGSLASHGAFLDGGKGVKIDWTSNAGDTYWYFALKSANLVQGDTYTLSFYCSGLGSTTVMFRWCNLSGYECYLKNGFNSYTFSMPSTNITNPFFDDINRDTTLSDLRLWNFQLEAKDHATGYTPDSRSSGTLVDTSGNGYNGTMVGSYLINYDSPRYNSCIDFKNSSYAVINNFLPTGYANTYTFAFWAKYTNGNMVFGHSNGNRLNLYSSSIFTWNTGDGNSNAFKDSSGNTISVSNYVNVWHHYAVTGDGSTTKLYIDGVYAGAATFKAITGTTIYLSGWDTSSSYKLNNPISDFRIYATCLSADDVKALYNSPVSITDNGTLMAYEFVE